LIFVAISFWSFGGSLLKVHSAAGFSSIWYTAALCCFSGRVFIAFRSLLLNAVYGFAFWL
jgi:hypothetical protein